MYRQSDCRNLRPEKCSADADKTGVISLVQFAFSVLKTNFCGMPLENCNFSDL